MTSGLDATPIVITSTITTAIFAQASIIAPRSRLLPCLRTMTSVQMLIDTIAAGVNHDGDATGFDQWTIVPGTLVEHWKSHRVGVVLQVDPTSGYSRIFFLKGGLKGPIEWRWSGAFARAHASCQRDRGRL